jgi:hypothetical protein
MIKGVRFSISNIDFWATVGANTATSTAVVTSKGATTGTMHTKGAHTASPSITAASLNGMLMEWSGPRLLHFSSDMLVPHPPPSTVKATAASPKIKCIGLHGRRHEALRKKASKEVSRKWPKLAGLVSATLQGEVGEDEWCSEDDFEEQKEEEQDQGEEEAKQEEEAKEEGAEEQEQKQKQEEMKEEEEEDYSSSRGSDKLHRHSQREGMLSTGAKTVIDSNGGVMPTTRAILRAVAVKAGLAVSPVQHTLINFVAATPRIRVTNTSRTSTTLDINDLRCQGKVLPNPAAVVRAAQETHRIKFSDKRVIKRLVYGVIDSPSSTGAGLTSPDELVFTLQDQWVNGRPCWSTDVINGSRYYLYYYPRDGPPGTTAQEEEEAMEAPNVTAYRMYPLFSLGATIKNLLPFQVIDLLNSCDARTPHALDGDALASLALAQVTGDKSLPGMWCCGPNLGSCNSPLLVLDDAAVPIAITNAEHQYFFFNGNTWAHVLNAKWEQVLDSELQTNEGAKRFECWSKLLDVVLSCDTEGAHIVFTTDGSDPRTSLTATLGPFGSLLQPRLGHGQTVIKAIARCQGMEDSEVAERRFAVEAKVGTPSISLTWAAPPFLQVGGLAESFLSLSAPLEVTVESASTSMMIMLVEQLVFTDEQHSLASSSSAFQTLAATIQKEAASKTEVDTAKDLAAALEFIEHQYGSHTEDVLTRVQTQLSGRRAVGRRQRSAQRMRGPDTDVDDAVLRDTIELCEWRTITTVELATDNLTDGYISTQEWDVQKVRDSGDDGKMILIPDGRGGGAACRFVLNGCGLYRMRAVAADLDRELGKVANLKACSREPSSIACKYIFLRPAVPELMVNQLADGIAVDVSGESAGVSVLVTTDGSDPLERLEEVVTGSKRKHGLDLDDVSVNTAAVHVIKPAGGGQPGFEKNPIRFLVAGVHHLQAVAFISCQPRSKGGAVAGAQLRRNNRIGRLLSMAYSIRCCF